MKYKFKSYDLGDERIIIRFLWFPKIINNELRWLEMATFKQKYQQGGLLEPLFWCDTSWL